MDCSFDPLLFGTSLVKHECIRKPYWEWMLFAKLSLSWVRPLFLSCQVCNRSSRFLGRDVQEIIKMTPRDKQVMMFSETLSKEIRPVCNKFMQDVMSQSTYLGI